MIHEVTFLCADAVRKIVVHGPGQGVGFHPLAALPVAARRRDFADVDLRIEIGGKGLAVIPGVAVDNIQHAHFVQLVLQGPGRENIGHAGIKARTQQGREPGFAKAVGIGPLPLVFKLGRVQGLVIGRIQIVHAAFQAGVHNVQILIRQGEIADQIRLDLPDQPAEFRHVVRVHLGGVDVHARAGLDATACGWPG